MNKVKKGVGTPSGSVEGEISSMCNRHHVKFLVENFTDQKIYFPENGITFTTVNGTFEITAGAQSYLEPETSFVLNGNLTIDETGPATLTFYVNWSINEDYTSLQSFTTTYTAPSCVVGDAF